MTFVRILSVVAITIAALFGVGTAQANILQFNAMLDGAQEVGPVATPGTGVATVTLDDVTGGVSVNGTYQNLLGAAIAAHIHSPGAPGVAASPIVGLGVSGGTTGSFAGSGTLTAAQIVDMVNGLAYLNVHSQTFTGGEIRGQILAVPEPATLAMLALGGIGVLAVARRRRRPAA